MIKSFSNAVLSQQPSPKKFITYFDQSRPNSLRFVKKHERKICKKFLGLGCCDKTASENDFDLH